MVFITVWSHHITSTVELVLVSLFKDPLVRTLDWFLTLDWLKSQLCLMCISWMKSCTFEHLPFSLNL